jgi:hypothetical protein
MRLKYSCLLFAVAMLTAMAVSPVQAQSWDRRGGHTVYRSRRSSVRVRTDRTTRNEHVVRTQVYGNRGVFSRVGGSIDHTWRVGGSQRTRTDEYEGWERSYPYDNRRQPRYRMQPRNEFSPPYTRQRYWRNAISVTSSTITHHKTRRPGGSSRFILGYFYSTLQHTFQVFGV